MSMLTTAAVLTATALASFLLALALVHWCVRGVLWAVGSQRGPRAGS